MTECAEFQQFSHIIRKLAWDPPNIEISPDVILEHPIIKQPLSLGKRCFHENTYCKGITNQTAIIQTLTNNLENYKS